MWWWLSSVQLFVIPWAVACQAPLSIGFSRQEYWSQLPFSSPKKRSSWDLPKSGIEPGSPALQTFSLLTKLLGKPFLKYSCFTALYLFPLYTKMNQPYMYVYPLPFGFPSHLSHHSALSRVPWAIQSVPISYLFSIGNVHLSISAFPFIPPCLGIHAFVLHVSISGLQMRSSNRLVPNRKRSMSRLFIVTLLI